MGIGAIILKGVRMARGTVGAGAVVSRDVHEGARIRGNPALKADDTRNQTEDSPVGSMIGFPGLYRKM